jgi:5-methylcytosine-specific restriction endonuclease McrA
MYTPIDRSILRALPAAAYEIYYDSHWDDCRWSFSEMVKGEKSIAAWVRETIHIAHTPSKNSEELWANHPRAIY